MIAGDDQQRESVLPQCPEVIGSILKLLLSRALGQVTADYDEIGPFFFQPINRGCDDVRVICPKMYIRQMCNPGHEGSTVKS